MNQNVTFGHEFMNLLIIFHGCYTYLVHGVYKI